MVWQYVIFDSKATCTSISSRKSIKQSNRHWSYNAKEYYNVKNVFLNEIVDVIIISLCLVLVLGSETFQYHCACWLLFAVGGCVYWKLSFSSWFRRFHSCCYGAHYASLEWFLGRWDLPILFHFVACELFGSCNLFVQKTVHLFLFLILYTSFVAIVALVIAFDSLVGDIFYCDTCWLLDEKGACTNLLIVVSTSCIQLQTTFLFISVKW